MASVTFVAAVAVATATIATAVWIADPEVEGSLSDPPTVAEWCRHNTMLLESGYTPVELVSDKRDFRQHQQLQTAALIYVFLNTPPEPIRRDAERFQRAVTRRMEGSDVRRQDLEPALRVQAFLIDCP